MAHHLENVRTHFLITLAEICSRFQSDESSFFNGLAFQFMKVFWSTLLELDLRFMPYIDFLWSSSQDSLTEIVALVQQLPDFHEARYSLRLS